jgi:1,4-alpha-glucan branching enzyme
LITTMTGYLPKSGGILLLLIVLLHGCTGSSLFSETSAVRSSLFTYEGSAQSVCISGDFNQWSPDSHCMRRQKGVWRIHLMLPVGVYRYTFVINGRNRVVDPKALFAETDGFGHHNAIAIID